VTHVFNNFIGRFSLATKPRPQKLANFIDRLTAPLVVDDVILLLTLIPILTLKAARCSYFRYWL